MVIVSRFNQNQLAHDTILQWLNLFGLLTADFWTDTISKRLTDLIVCGR